MRIDEILERPEPIFSIEFFPPKTPERVDELFETVEAKIDAELALGRHASVLSQLNELVARDPLNEGLHRQRIIAQ